MGHPLSSGAMQRRLGSLTKGLRRHNTISSSFLVLRRKSLARERDADTQTHSQTPLGQLPNFEVVMGKEWEGKGPS